MTRPGPASHRIRGMEPGDLPAVCAIAATCGVGLGSDASFKALLPRYEVFVAALENGQIAGFAAAAPLSVLAGEADGDGSEGCFWIGALAVDPAHRRHGLGTALLGAVTARANWFFCRALGLSDAREANAIRFAERHRFLAVDPENWTPALRKQISAQCPDGASLGERRLLIRWL
ncbi:GNAT family N-acetyltransferase [Aureimonas ureilytica]|nr:GNAT family N-acetyltransferase [Aureimonas ureilytica]